MSDHPYKNQPDYARWLKAMARLRPEEVDPVVKGAFLINRRDPVMTAGSCFAQHVARQLRNSEFNFLVTEKAHPIVPKLAAEEQNYGLFTARYGNLYTTRQLLQLFKRVFGTFTPVEDIWTKGDVFVDPFRPQISPEGFATQEEYWADRKKHFAAVRQAFETTSVFVFTLGLTETWASRADGSVYPLCPGVAGGTFDESKYEFLNLGVSEVVADMVEFIDLLRAVNPAVRLITTVSPVPLIATALDRHVLVSTTYSKSVLRVACEEIATARPGVVYFPSYEIITGNHTRGAYFESDLRSVTEAGVNHVMRLFLQHFANSQVGGERPRVDEPNRRRVDRRGGEHLREMTQLMRVLCDEEALERAE